MNTPRPIALALAALVAAAGGCISVNNTDLDSTSANRVTHDQMQSLAAANRRLGIGMDKAAALALYPAHLTTLVSSANIQGHRVEEWRVDALRADGNAYFRRYLYFTDGKLSEFGDTRLDYRDNPAVHGAWLGPESGR